ncbi:transmembrane protein, putative (macronuclear) [Tetrahymena thermophila SB210]|uniref:Transmembrane protein, putative n=1 Tax=Tetrahymena thermophila (strain SB210) TaxID=312017 RepID=Q232V9_TETTS|nr:transmembrane protein, putative [Tetrahymena thermophila SB210]EAR91721.3 transmembrane protein, putative [Tetrahymena thermophila SB210]|eukprot:XP_001011966.3 transmembrane protein, putative [Tetrahymena thermophila SB210]
MYYKIDKYNFKIYIEQSIQFRNDLFRKFQYSICKQFYFNQCLLFHKLKKARSLSVFILLFNPLLFSQDFTLVFRRFVYLCPCFVWNHAFVQILQFFCNLYFQGYGGDWQKCFNITYDFSSKIIYGIFGVAVIDGLFRQDHVNFFSNGLIIVATHLVITICSLIFFAFNICKMITNLSDYQNMQELVKVKNKTQEFAIVLGLCYGLRISYYYIYAFEIRADDQSDDSWIIVIVILIFSFNKLKKMNNKRTYFFAN